MNIKKNKYVFFLLIISFVFVPTLVFFQNCAPQQLNSTAQLEDSQRAPDDISSGGQYYETGALEAPVITPNGGSYTGNVVVGISTSIPEAFIRYTTDGSTPNCTKTEQALHGNVIVSQSLTLKAIGCTDTPKKQYGAMATAVFVINSHGNTLNVPSTQYPTIQSAINAAQLGDTIVVEAGRTYTENLILKYKSNGSGWITIQSSKLNQLPGAGNRVSPSDAVNMPKLQSTHYAESVLSTQSGSTPTHHYKLIGLEISRRTDSPSSTSYNLINFGTEGSQQNTLDKVPYDFVIDRCYVHGLDNAATRRGLNISAKNVQVLNSYFSKFHDPGFDSQAILAWNTPGDVIIKNNFLEGASENFMVGGVEITIPGIVVTNILVEHNHFFKPLSWRGQNKGVKNLIEFKNGKDAVVRYNIFENVWGEAQDGSAVVLTPRVDATGVRSRVQDIRFEYNILKNVGGVFQMLSENDYGGEAERTEPLKNITIENNLAISAGSDNGNNGRINMFSKGRTTNGQISENIIMNHNTFIMGGNSPYRSYAMDGSGFISNLVFNNNIVAQPNGSFFGVHTSGMATGTASLNESALSWSFNKNALQMGASGHPNTSFYTSNINGFSFVNHSAGDYRLSSSSSYKSAGTDGKDIGADIEELNRRTACVVHGQQSQCQ